MKSVPSLSVTNHMSQQLVIITIIIINNNKKDAAQCHWRVFFSKPFLLMLLRTNRTISRSFRASSSRTKKSAPTWQWICSGSPRTPWGRGSGRGFAPPILSTPCSMRIHSYSNRCFVWIISSWIKSWWWWWWWWRRRRWWWWRRRWWWWW